jgi:hypothetical protein
VVVFGVPYLVVGACRAWWRQRVETERVRDEEWAKTLTVAAEHGWPPYVEVAGLSRRAELAWRETYLRTARHCSPVTMPDGRTEWIYTRPKEEQR